MAKELICPTHPWITFELDMRRLSPEFWMYMGEARSKVNHIGSVPLTPRVAQRLHRLSLAKGVHGTTAIEGNSLSLDSVSALIEGKPAHQEDYNELEIENLVSLFGATFQELANSGKKYKISRLDLLKLHREILAEINVKPEVVPGEFRHYGVGVGRYGAPDAKYVETLVEQMCEWLNQPIFLESSEDQRVCMAIIRAALAHLYIAWIHPFGDGNGRLARLVEFKILISAGIPTAAAHILSNFYNETRTQYYSELEYTSKARDVTNFLLYVGRGFCVSMREQLAEIYHQVDEVSWRDYIHSVINRESDLLDKVASRLRKLAVAIADEPQPLPLSSLRLRAEVAVIYTRLSAPTLTNDLRRLVEFELILETEGGYRAKRELLYLFKSQSLNLS